MPSVHEVMQPLIGEAAPLDVQNETERKQGFARRSSD